MKLFVALFCTLVVALGNFSEAAPGPSEPLLRPGDVLATLGGEEMVSMTESGELELALTIAQPELRLSLRTLAWEGDTVYEQRRDLNYPSLPEQLDQVGATVVLVQFGQMESLGGPERLAEFSAAYERLLKRLKGEEERRFILVLPHDFVAPGRQGLPDLSRYNADAQAYAQAIRGLAGKLRIPAVSAEIPVGAKFPPLTRDGIHPNRTGEMVRAYALARALLPGSSSTFSQEAGNAESLTPLRQLIREKSRLWFNYYRPQNWAFLAGDRINQPSSRDHLNQEKRWFPAEMAEYLPLISAKEREIWMIAEAWKKP